MGHVSLGIVGCGNRGSELLRKFSDDERVSIKYVCDRDSKKMDPLQARHQGAKFTSDYCDLIDDTELDTVVIATPLKTHFDLAHEALLASKNVLVEAPMCSTSTQCKDLTQLASKVNRKLMVGHTLVYHPAIRRINQMIEKRETGYLCYLNFSHSAPAHGKMSENVLWRLAYQDMAVLDFFLGEAPLTVQASGASHLGKQKESIVHVTMSFEGNTLVHMEANEESPMAVHQIAIGCEKKTIHFDRHAISQSVRIYDTQLQNGSNNGVSLTSPCTNTSVDVFSPSIAGYQALDLMCRHFIDCIETNNRPFTDGEAGMRVVNMLQMAEAALKSRETQTAQ